MNNIENMEKRLVVQANSLIEASYRLKPSQQKFLRIMASMINKDDEDFKTYEFKISELISLFEVKDQSKYNEIPKQTRELMGNVLTFKTDKKIIQVPFLNYCEYEFGAGIMRVQFHPYLKPFYLYLGKENPYTKYELKNILTLKSIYSIRIYELLKQFEKIGFRTIEINKLREIFQIEPSEYIRYNDFKRFVLLQAQKELPLKTDITFEFEEIKEKRKVVAIKFNVRKTNKIAAVNEAQEKTIDKDLRLIMEITNNEFGEKTAILFKKLSNGDISHIQKLYEYMNTRNINENRAGYMRKLLENFEEPKTSTGVCKTKFNNFEARNKSPRYLYLEEQCLLGQATDEERKEFDIMRGNDLDNVS